MLHLPTYKTLSDPALNYSAIELNVDNRVALIRLNRPSDGNAVTVELATEKSGAERAAGHGLGVGQSRRVQ